MTRARARATKSSKRPTVVRRRRKERARPTPRWLTGRTDLDQMAQRRCLLVLSVLSGEKTVTTAIEELQISRPFYYQLETKALLAMLRSLAPGADGSTNPDDATPARRIAELEREVARLEREKRRAERLWSLAKRIVPTGPLTLGVGRPRKTPQATRSTTTGSLVSRRVTTKPRTTVEARPSSTPPTAGEGER